jgi:glutathione S-transferase
MVLIGQYDSPFVRRVAIALRRYGLTYQHQPWSVWGDAERISAHNPLRRVPVLVLDDGQALVESAAILDALDDLVGPERALLPRGGPQRRTGLRVCALATGLGDKAVTLLYEHVLRSADRRSDVWVGRCQGQIRDTLALLEGERARLPGPFWLGDRLGHADVAVACVLRFLGEAHPALWRPAEHPALAVHAERCEALPEFREVYQRLEVDVSPS